MALLVANLRNQEELDIVDKRMKDICEQGVYLASHGNVHLDFDRDCLGLTTLYEPEPANDLGTELVSRNLSHRT